MTAARGFVLRRGAALVLLAALVATGADASPPVELVVATADGASLHLSDYRGRWLLVNLWATWCSSCAAEMPALSRLAGRQQRLAIVGLTDERLTPDALRTFRAAHPVDYPVAVVDGAKLPADLAPTAFGIGMRPISYLVDPDGTVVERYVGRVDEDALQRRIVEARP